MISLALAGGLLSVVQMHVETAIVCIFVISGALIWTNILARFCDVATNSHPGMVLYRQTVDELSFIESNEVPPHLQARDTSISSALCRSVIPPPKSSSRSLRPYKSRRSSSFTRSG